MQLISTAFQQSEAIPQRYSGEGDDVSPPMIWSGLPTGCKSLALLCEDPDAPKLSGHDHPFVHWLIYNIDPSMGMLPEGVPADWKVQHPLNCEQGLNSMGRPGYNGPFPPEGHGMHRYLFTLYALQDLLALPARPMREHFLKAAEGKVLASTQLLGTFEREAEIILRAAG